MYYLLKAEGLTCSVTSPRGCKHSDKMKKIYIKNNKKICILLGESRGAAIHSVKDIMTMRPSEMEHILSGLL